MKNVVVIILLAVILYGCSDDASGPGKGSEQPVSGFRITAITPDTLYTGETAWVRVKEMGDTLENISLFVHSIQAEVLRIADDTLFFEIPRNATTARIRVYKYDSIEAKGDFSLNLLPHHIDFNFDVDGVFPGEGYEGDVITIFGKDFPLRKREIEVSINGVKLEIDTFSSTQILARVTNGVQNGKIEVRLRGQFYNAGDFKLLNHGVYKLLESTYYFETILNAILIEAEFEGNNMRDSVGSTTKPSFGVMVRCAANHIVTRSDSIRASINEESLSAVKRMHLSLKETPGKNEVSGKIVLEQVSSRGTPNEVVDRVVIVVDKIRWKNIGGGYELYANGPEITSKVKVLEFEQHAGTNVSKIVNYRGGGISSQFSLRVR